MEIRKQIILIFAGIVCCGVIKAQEYNKYEVSAWTGIGLSTLEMKMSEERKENNGGGLLGAGCTYFYSPNVGLMIGAELSFYNAKLVLDHYEDAYDTEDYDGTEFEFRTKVSDYDEMQKMMTVNIPLMVQYQTSGKHKLFLAAGGKIGLPIYKKYNITIGSLVNSGYYPHENYEYTTQEFMGFGTFTDRSVRSNLELKVTYMASAEVGMKWALGSTSSIYTGVYLDYGLNDINKYTGTGLSRNLVKYNTPDPRNFILNSASSTNIVTKINTMAIGAKIRMAFGGGKKQRVVE